MHRHGRFETLYRAHAGAVLAYALRRTDSATAEDVLGDVFLATWRRLDDVPDDALPWLLGTARRMLANRRRGEARRVALGSRLAHEHRPVPPESPGASESDERLLAALRSLRSADRELLLLIAWEGLEPSRAAQALGVRPGTLAVRLHRARRRFTQALMEQDARAVDAETAREVF